VHIHLAEDAIDARKDGSSTVSWLAERGLVTERALFAHAVHASDQDLERILGVGARVVHNPRSNLNNAVGYARPARFGAQGLLGTDGIGADMRAEAFAAFLAARHHRHAFDAVAALERSRGYAGALFGSRLGTLEPGAAADLIALDYRSPTPIEPANLDGHLLFGLGAAKVRHALVGGELVLRDGRSTRLDEEALYSRARTVARRLWDKL
jgi:cytosine/adenosine deaminase-related metal-dependent hydrolase